MGQALTIFTNLLFQINFYFFKIPKHRVRVGNGFKQLFILLWAEVSLNPVCGLLDVCMPPFVTPATEYLAVQEIESGEGINAFRKDMGDIEKIIRLSPTAHDAPLTVSFYTGDFEEFVEMVNLFLTGAFLWDCGVPAVSFFFGLRGAHRIQLIRLWRAHWFWRDICPNHTIHQLSL